MNIFSKEKNNVMERLVNENKVIELTKQIGDVLVNHPFLEAIMALATAFQCSIEDCVQEEKQIEVVSTIMGKIITGIVKTRMDIYKKPEFEFKKIVAGRGGGLAPSSLNEMEADGWELVGQNDLEYIFRRKKK